uniref:SFRICE_022699 n=1 Tax=Spodoptera frugiperda TaxID=7108 RepID=A0A2H1W6W9_SPOFR
METDHLTQRKHCLIHVGFLLPITLLFCGAVGLVFAYSGPDLPPGPYCGRTGQCCQDRQDSCSHRILDSKCYCDQFCNRTQGHDDCCPDYPQVCLGETPPPEKNTMGCRYGRNIYVPGDTVNQDCHVWNLSVVEESGLGKIERAFFYQTRAVVSPDDKKSPPPMDTWNTRSVTSALPAFWGLGNRIGKIRKGGIGPPITSHNETQRKRCFTSVSGEAVSSTLGFSLVSWVHIQTYTFTRNNNLCDHTKSCFVGESNPLHVAWQPVVRCP